ncbi:hypothetical protein MKQ68_08680 [Chitinophaga horti]|uniref:YXWGXW repeat-containing protein n=1 Tax=Chitinophaga horti TaxID=2920382 RepID=A0ABY6JA52_9BACT|nr:DUF6600 domain-containing protein [Chitinophaga horti]UYQ95171.1 hypothetical protein MKQ68_08680 [Chitinophaga horti]
MKKVFAVALFAGIFIAAMPTLATASPLQDYYDDGPVTYQTFYDELSPYGRWIDDSEYGYVWQPNEGADFRPYYTNGNWQYTTYGWTWVSSYRWGWAPFHYGRWRMDPFYGWVWIPGYEWGPAWVSWRNNAGMCGWAPMGPGVSINLSFNAVIPVNHWVFLETRWLGHRSYYNHCMPFRSNNVYYNNTVIVRNTYVYNNRTYINGPDASWYRRSTGRDLRPAAIRSERRPGQDRVGRNEVRMYRPEVRQYASNGRNDNARPAPSRVFSRSEGARPDNNGRTNGQWTRDNDNSRRRDNQPQRSFDNQWSRDNDRNDNDARPTTPRDRSNWDRSSDNNDRGNVNRPENRNNLPERSNDVRPTTPRDRSNWDRNNDNNDRGNVNRPENRNNLPERSNDVRPNTPRDNNIPDRGTVNRPDNRNNLPERNNDVRPTTPRERGNWNRPGNENRTSAPENRRTFERSTPQRAPQMEQRRAMPEQRSQRVEQPRQSAPGRSFERQAPQQRQQPSNNGDRGGRRGSRES